MLGGAGAQLGMNLYEFIKQNNFQGLSCDAVRTINVQLLNALTVTQTRASRTASHATLPGAQGCTDHPL